VTSAVKLLLTEVINSGYHQEREPNRCEMYRNDSTAVDQLSCCWQQR